jgi:hypothetical protein
MSVLQGLSPEIISALIAGAFLTVSTAASTITAIITRRTSAEIKQDGLNLSKRFDESTKISFVEGERACFAALVTLTLEEKSCVGATRFGQRSIHRQPRYFNAIRARLVGEPMEGHNYGQLDKYMRLASLTSDENKTSLVSMIEEYLELGVNNVVIRVTADKNDFELLVFEDSKAIALCLHDMSKQDVVHSCMIIRDNDLYLNFYQLYDKLWNEDILLEFDFSHGRKHIEDQLGKLRRMEAVKKNFSLPPVNRAIDEARKKISAFGLVGDTYDTISTM